MSSLSTAVTPARVARPPVRLSHLGDELLARQAARGSERAFAALYERYHQQLYRYCRSILHDDADAQDALQSTFAGALQALRRDGRSAPLRPWLYRIAHNEAISLLRRRSRNETDELDAETLRASSSVEQEAADRARWVRLVADLRRLPERQRGALLLRELSGLSHDEIAIALGTTTGAAKQAIFEARQALTELEDGRSMSCEEARRRISEGDRRVLRGRRVSAHLHACAGCEAFALAIPARRAELRALTPALPPAVASAVLARSVQATSTHGSSVAAATAGAAGKTVGAAMAWKALAGVAVIAAAAAGVSGLRHSPRSHETSAESATAGATQVTHSAASHAAGVTATPVRHSAHRSEAARPAAPPARRAIARPGAAGVATSPSQAGPAHGVNVVAESTPPTVGGHTSAAQAGTASAGVGRHLGHTVGSVGSTAGSVVKTAGSVVKTAGSVVKTVTSAAVNAVSSVAKSATSTVVNATSQVTGTVTGAAPATAPVVNTVTNVVGTIVPPVGTGTGPHPLGGH